MNDQELMRAALAVAQQASASGDVPVGAVIVNSAGEVVATGHNERELNNDPTAHAEVTAIRDACTNLESFQLDGCEIYTSCEPCPMCLGAIYWARPDKVYFGSNQVDAANIGFDDEWIREFFLFEDMQNIGYGYNGSNQSDNSQFRITAVGSADIGDHALSLGFEYELLSGGRKSLPHG